VDIVLTIPGQPVPQPRPRISTRGGIGRAYVPSDHPIHVYRQAVELLARGLGTKPDNCDYEVVIEAVFARPPSHWTKSGLASKAPRRPAPDWDNVAKGVQDAITNAGTIWYDDDQVVDGRCRKRYAERGEASRTVITIRRLPP
jgi:Holliday junction resolvase RusA-like endonuclease